MRIIGLVFAALIALVVGGVMYLGMADVAVPQTPISKTIEPAGN